MYAIDIYGISCLQQIRQRGFHVLRSLRKHFQYAHSTCMTTFQCVTMNNSTNLNIQHDLFVELENFYDHVDQNSEKRTIGMFTVNLSKTTYVVYFISNQYFP